MIPSPTYLLPKRDARPTHEVLDDGHRRQARGPDMLETLDPPERISAWEDGGPYFVGGSTSPRLKKSSR